MTSLVLPVLLLPFLKLKGKAALRCSSIWTMEHNTVPSTSVLYILAFLFTSVVKCSFCLRIISPEHNTVSCFAVTLWKHWRYFWQREHIVSWCKSLCLCYHEVSTSQHLSLPFLCRDTFLLETISYPSLVLRMNPMFTFIISCYHFFFISTNKSHFCFFITHYVF